MSILLEEIRKRRKKLGLKQKDMMLRIGMSPQQYHHLESKGNPRLDTLELVAKGVKSEIMLIPLEKLASVKALIDGDRGDFDTKDETDRLTVADDPWKDILEDEEFGDDE